MLDPNTQAKAVLNNEDENGPLRCPTYSAHTSHDPSSRIIVEAHIRRSRNGYPATWVFW